MASFDVLPAPKPWGRRHRDRTAMNWGAVLLSAGFLSMGALAALSPAAHGQTEEDSDSESASSRLQDMVEASKRRAAEYECKVLRQQGKACAEDESGVANSDVTSESIPFDVEISANIPPNWKSFADYNRLPYSKIIKVNQSDNSSEYFIFDRDYFLRDDYEVSLETKWTINQFEGNLMIKRGCIGFPFGCSLYTGGAKSYPFSSPIEIDVGGERFKLYGENGLFVLPSTAVKAISENNSYVRIYLDNRDRSLAQIRQGSFSNELSLEIGNDTLKSLKSLYLSLLRTTESPGFNLVTLEVSDASTFQALVGHTLQRVVAIERGSSSGTGFIAGSQGLIFTNRHVVGQSKTVDVTYFDGTRFDGSVIFKSYETDFAIIEVSNPPEISSLPLCYNKYPNPGDDITVLGSPLGLANTVTRGIVSAIRTSSGNQINNIPEGVVLIQTDASVNPGNSGGPMINDQGEVIGIVTYKHSFGEGLGFATSIIDVLESLEVQRPAQSVDTAMTPCGNITNGEQLSTSPGW